MGNILSDNPSVCNHTSMGVARAMFSVGSLRGSPSHLF